MDGLQAIYPFGLLLLAVAMLCIRSINAQHCIDVEHTGAGTASVAAWPVTWVPGCTEKLKFSVKMDGGDGVARIILAADTVPSTPYVVIQLGWDDDRSDLDNVVSYMGVCTTDDTVCTHQTAFEVYSTSNGDVNENEYVDFYLTAGVDSIHVGYVGERAFMSLNDLDNSLLSPQDIRYVGIQSHDGTGMGGMDQSSAWKFCTDEWQSLVPEAVGGAVNDGDVESCGMISVVNPGLSLDLGEELHVSGVTIYISAHQGTIADLNDAVVTVGNCNDPEGDVMCGSKITNEETMSSAPVFRPCPTNTYGRYVIISRRGDNLPLCEVIVHGKAIPDADKTRFEFTSATFSVMEFPGLAGCSDHNDEPMLTLTVKRTGSAHRFTCDVMEIADTSTGTATDGDDYQLDYTTQLFESGVITADVPDVLIIFPDCEYEEDEKIILELVGSQSSTTITILDDDQKYTFTVSEASVWENDASGKIGLTIERSGHTDTATIIHVITDNCDGSESADNPDYVSWDEPQPILFDVGDTSKTVDIYINDDDGNVDYLDEEFCVHLVNDLEILTRSGQLAPHPTVTVTILNDDTLYGPCDPAYEILESDEEAHVAICRLGKVDTVGCVDVYSDIYHRELPGVFDMATEGIDYLNIKTTISFPGSVEIQPAVFHITNDKHVEPTEGISLALALPTTSCGADWSPVIGDSEAAILLVDDDTLYSVTSLVDSVLENAGSVTVYFSRLVDSLVDRAGTIKVLVSGSTDPDSNVGTSFATKGVDFVTEGEYEVSFQPGEIVAELAIPIIDDPNIELNEIFYVEILESDDSEINEGRKRMEVTIINDDAYYSIERIERSVLESVEEFQVVVLRGSLEVNGITIPPYLGNDVSVTLNTNSAQNSAATAGSDFETVSQTLTFLGASQDSVKTQVIKVINDEVVEGEEIFFVTISNDNVQISPDRGQAKITIEDDDGRISCSVNGETSVTVREDQGSITVTCTRDGIDNADGNDQSLNRVAQFILTAVPETARQGDDFKPYQATLEFPTGEDTITEILTNFLTDDTDAETPETFRLELSYANNEVDAAGGGVAITVLDDDIELFGFDTLNYIVGESCDKLQVTVTRSGSGGVGTTVRITASNGIGTNGAVYPDDYTTLEATVYFVGNQQAQTVPFNLNRDDDNEGSESFTLRLSIASGAGEIDPTADVATVTIEDQTVTYAVQDAQIFRDEFSGTASVFFVRNGDFCDADEIYVSTRDGSAKPGEDYVSFNNRAVSFDSTSNTASVDLVIINDNVEEQAETFTIEIEGARVQSGTGTTTVTIQDDDGRVYFRQTEYNVPEGASSVNLIIERAGNALRPTNVRVQTVSGRGNAIAGTDYVVVNNWVITFDVSETSKTVPVEISNDNLDEDDETFYVAIVSTTDGVVSDPTEAIVTILDDDERRGLSTPIVIGIAAGVGGGVLLLVFVGGCLCFYALRQNRGPTAAGIPGRPPLLAVYSAPGNYPPSYRNGSVYGPPQRIGYYR